MHRFVTESGLGEVLAAPCDVVLERMTVVQPDLLFVSTERSHIVGPAFIAGPPDLAIEIISPGDPDHDRGRKHALYARHGVREHWIVDPPARTIEVFVLEVGTYRMVAHAGAGDTVASIVLADFQVAVDEIVPAK